MTPNLEAKCLEVLADAVSRTVGTGFVHAAVIKAAESLDEADRDKASKAFQLLIPICAEVDSRGIPIFSVL